MMVQVRYFTKNQVNSITFEEGVTQYIPNGAAMYTSNPLPRVFASNDKSNRIILELVIMAR